MRDLARVNEYIAHSRTVASLDGLSGLTADMSRDMGFDLFTLTQRDLSIRDRPAERFFLSTYPEGWIERIVEQRYYADDPAYLASCRTSVGFTIADIPRLIPLTSRQRLILEEARRAGVGEAFTVPGHIPGESNGIATFAVRAGRELPSHRLPMAQLVGAFAYEAARRLRADLDKRSGPVTLSARQIECVLYVAKGKTDWEIAQILGIREDTVTEHVDEARRRYDVAKRAQLVVRALYDGHISLTDALS